MSGDIVVPGPLRRAVARLLVLGLREQARRDGDLRPTPGLARFLAALDGFGPETEVAIMTQERHDWVSAAQAAQVIGCSPQFARRLAASGRLTARRRGDREWEIDRQSAHDYADTRRRRHGAA